MGASHKTQAIINLTRREYFIFYTNFHFETLLKSFKKSCQWQENDTIITTLPLKFTKNCYKYNFELYHCFNYFKIETGLKDITVAIAEYDFNENKLDQNLKKQDRIISHNSIKKLYLISKITKNVIEEIDISELKNIRDKYDLEDKYKVKTQSKEPISLLYTSLTQSKEPISLTHISFPNTIS